MPVVDRYDAIQYDGTNKAAIAAAVPQYVFVSETAAGLQFKSGAATWFCPPNGWVVYSERYHVAVSQWNTTAAFELAYRELIAAGAIGTLQGDVTALQGDVGTLQGEMSAAQAGVDALEASLTGVLAAVADGLSGAGAGTYNFGLGSTTVNVDISPAQAGTGYTANPPRLFGGVNLGALTITGYEVVDADTVSVTVNNSGLLALGASILVTVKP